jgi:DNA modification methylase
MELTGFDAVEIDMALAIDEPGVDTIESESAEDLSPPSSPSVKSGDVYFLGRHTIACGDARDAVLVNLLAKGRKTSVVFTDPPYIVKSEGFTSSFGDAKLDGIAMASGEVSGGNFKSILFEFLAAMIPALRDGAILFVCMDWRDMGELLRASELIGLDLKNVCVWTKSDSRMDSLYRAAHKLVFVFKHGQGAHQGIVEPREHGRRRSNVWSYREVNVSPRHRMQSKGAHPQVMPTLMIADALNDVSRPDDLVFDPFLGSGSTLLAAEETGRVCLGMDLDPGYVEVAIRRWEKRTHRDAIDAKTGQTFSSLREQTLSAAAEVNVEGDSGAIR